MSIPKVTVNEIMTKDVIVVTKDDTIQSAAKLMRNYSIKNIPVINEKREITGVVSAKDIIYKVVSENRNNNLPVEEIMTRDNLVFSRYTDTIIEISELMNKKGLSVLPVINEKEELVGIISKTDLLSVYPLLVEKFKV